MSANEHPVWHKVREMLLEIAIIVFAVSLSIWLHSLGEHRHEQKQVKAFLVGLKQDIRSDLELVEFNRAFYRHANANFKYLGSLEPAQVPEEGRFEAAYLKAMSNVSFFPRLSRYEGFKSSGKLTNIENAPLLQKILDLYQSSLPFIRVSEDGWRKNHDKLRDYLDPEYDSPDGAARRYALVTEPLGKRLARRAVANGQLDERYAAYAKLGAGIIAEIDKAYPEQAAKTAR